MEQISQSLKEFKPEDYLAIAAPLVVLILSGSLGKNKKEGKGGNGGNWPAYWFLFNAIVIHLFLDGFVGGFELVPPLFRQYCILDRRYLAKDALVMLVCYLELFVMFPLCLLTYRALIARKPNALLLQLVTSLIQLIGTYFFTLQEVMGGFKHVPIDRNLEFTFHYVFYFWIFFVAANLLWSLLPLYLISVSWRKIAAGKLKDL